MIKRVIAQSGTGLALWSVNRQPMRLIERLSQEFGCQRKNDSERFECLQQLIQRNEAEFYRLHLSLSIGRKALARSRNPYVCRLLSSR